MLLSADKGASLCAMDRVVIRKVNRRNASNDSLKYQMPMLHRYVRIDNRLGRNRYVYLRQNPFLLAWRLYWYGKPFGFRGRSLKEKFAGLKRLFRLAVTLCYFRLRSPTSDDLLDLPVHGQFCLQLKNGHKVFNFRRQKVVKVFGPDIDLPAVKHEIDQARWIGTHPFAPSVRRWNIEQRWYEEDYVNGYPGTRSNWAVFLRTFRASVAPLLARMIVASPPQEISSLEYAERRGALILGDRTTLADVRLDRARVDRVRSFVEATIEKLRLAGDRTICLVCSHGDFSPGHVLMNRQKAVIIDWEILAQRSALYDFYDYFFERLWLGHLAPGMAIEMGKAISQLESYLAADKFSDCSSLTASFHNAEVCRLVYYVERISKVVERQKLSDVILDRSILRLIDAYDKYEKSLLDGASWSFQSTDWLALPRSMVTHK